MPDPFSFIRRVSLLGTMLHTAISGHEVGRDAFGNRYYRARRPVAGMREKRWVIYAGEPEASKIPAEWHIWLHHTAEAPIPDAARKSWQKPHIENMTGTATAWLPPSLDGHTRGPATGDYQAWKPE